MTGSLVLVATPIGNLGDLSPRAAETLAAADVIACEDTRHTRKLLSASGLSAKLIAVHEHNERARIDDVLRLLAEGKTVALVSDAGTPAISDPGERLVAAVAAAGYDVRIVPGPSAVVAALAVSGLPTGRFCFEGFLPRKGRDRAERLAAIASEERTVVLYEAPSRVTATVAELAAACGADRRVALVRELTKLFEEVWRGSLGEAVAHLDATEPRGEYVVVVEGRVPERADEASIEAELRAELAAGATKKDAVARVAAELRVPKRTVYDAALRLDDG